MRREARWQAPIRTTTTILFGVVAASLSACSDLTRPIGFDADLRGRWVLVAVDGQPLPVPLDPGAEIVAGELELLADGSYWSSTHATIAGVAFHDLWKGRWSIAADRILLERAGQTAVFAGTWNGVTIEIAGTRAMRYARPPAAPTPTAGSPTQPKKAPKS